MFLLVYIPVLSLHRKLLEDFQTVRNSIQHFQGLQCTVEPWRSE